MDPNVLNKILSSTHRNSVWRFIQALFYIAMMSLAIIVIWLLIVKVIPTLVKILPLVNDILQAEKCNDGKDGPPKSNVGKIVSDVICYDENSKAGRKPYTTVGDTYKTILNIERLLQRQEEARMHPTTG